jgi:nicotinate-nucleotide pyrophosphorylase (carboxylating)
MDITPAIKYLICLALREDLLDGGDITSRATIPEDKTMTAIMRSRENGILAGLDIAMAVYREKDSTLELKPHKHDGDSLSPGMGILEVSGKAHSILAAERTALNFMTHLSGIASETAKYVQAVQGTQARILDTRKTLPGYRRLQKHAVKMGGGDNHRMGLYDAILIKDNHIAAAGGITAALNSAKENYPDTSIEIEVDTLAQLQEVLDHGGADIVLLDNMTPQTLKEAVALCAGALKTEASGGITLENVKEYAITGVDYISIGALTHSVRTLDIGLDYFN